MITKELAKSKCSEHLSVSLDFSVSKVLRKKVVELGNMLWG
jgi:hypothetical protein